MVTNTGCTVVVKLGTSVLTGGSRCLDQAVMVELVRQCVQLQHAGHRVVWVTSGAVTAGRSHLQHLQLPDTVAAKQLLASVGQVCLIQIWQRLFAIYGLQVGQMLLTRADLEDRERFLNARDTLLALLNQRIIPVINENDAIATAEIKIGDNDNLSALVAILANADKLLLLTDQQGLFTADPRCNPNAQLLQEINTIDDDLRSIAGRSLSGLGVGGMSTKLQAAEIASRAGIEVVIAAGHQPGVMSDMVLGKSVGTRFHPFKTALEKRKWWILGAPISGEIVVDSGAAQALCQGGASLLPKGICQIKGDFSRGDVIRLCSQDRLQLAYGVSCYESDALRVIAGHHSRQISTLLGYTYGSVAVHRDDMIVTYSEATC